MSVQLEVKDFMGWWGTIYDSTTIFCYGTYVADSIRIGA